MEQLNRIEKVTVCLTAIFVGVTFYDDLLTAILYAVLCAALLAMLILYIKNHHGGDFQG